MPSTTGSCRKNLNVIVNRGRPDPDPLPKGEEALLAYTFPTAAAGLSANGVSGAAKGLSTKPASC